MKKANKNVPQQQEPSIKPLNEPTKERELTLEELRAENSRLRSKQSSADKKANELSRELEGVAKSKEELEAWKAEKEKESMTETQRILREKEEAETRLKVLLQEKQKLEIKNELNTLAAQDSEVPEMSKLIQYIDAGTLEEAKGKYQKIKETMSSLLNNAKTPVKLPNVKASQGHASLDKFNLAKEKGDIASMLMNAPLIKK